MSEGLASQNILFIGAGSMAEAIIRGIVSARLLPSERIYVTNRSNEQQLQQLTAAYGVRTGCGEQATQQYLQKADIIVLAMKPKDASTALQSLKPYLRADQLLISVIAGLSISAIEQAVGNGMPVVRTMPNTSSSIGLGATGLCFSERASARNRQHAAAIFSAIGLTAEIEEEQMHGLTGVSGSGPAYIYYMMEALVQAGIDEGLSPEQARELTVQTVLGAASMVKHTGEDPAELRRKVTSPNGTTEAAIAVLNAKGFQPAVREAVQRAAERSREIAEMIAGDIIESR
ncbi:pyrroline-5-carboxylate reductase [Paenibacillus senegalensis]|uniref:pyrroline-5-carboxylate reductase n=1 Tax=Paenibacillus senegalensis TaxID=1465766 RepID=UPI000289F19B|nr:pyrroline-5-carboxylate reductase [Paenibacillus senegalensis]